MPRIAALALALAAASLPAGCQGKESTPSPAAGSQAAGSQAAGSQAAGSQAAPTAGAELTWAESLRRITGLADKICACPDRACADALYAVFQTENQRLANRPRPTPTPAEGAAMQAEAKRLSGCLTKLAP
jgi:hypothetical protein